MTSSRVRLEKFVREYSVRNKEDEDIPVYSVTNSHGFCTEYFSKDVASKDKTTYKVVPRGYFAYNPSRINVGSVDWQKYEDRVIVSPLYNVFSVSDEVDRQYLYYFFRSHIGRQMIKAKASGSVRDNLKIEMLKEMTIPDISIQEQRFYASVLDKLQLLVGLKKGELQQLNDLVKARFVEMFGDGDYPVVKAEEVCEFITKGTTPKADEIYAKPFVDCIPYLKVYNLSFTGKMLFWDTPQYIGREIHEGKLSRSKVYPGDVLMNIVGPPLGKFAIVNDDFKEWNINQAIAIFRSKGMIKPKFLLHVLLQADVLAPFMKKANGVRQLNLTLEQCRNLQFPLPTLCEQNLFIDFVEQVDKSKASSTMVKNKKYTNLSA